MVRLYNVPGKCKAVLVLESLDALLQSNMSLSILPVSGGLVSHGGNKSFLIHSQENKASLEMVFSR